MVQSQPPEAPAPAVVPGPAPQQSGDEQDTKRDEGKSETSKTEEKIVAKEAKANLKPVVSKPGITITPLFGLRKLKEDTYLFSESDTASIKKWLFKKGTEVKVVQSGSEGWLRVVDSENKGGWIRTEVLEQLK